MPRAAVSPQTRDVLQQLLREPEAPHYGYDLSRKTGLASGTLYPILIRLTERGWLEAQWAEPERVGRPPRHLYRLTADGVAAAKRITADDANRGSLRPRPTTRPALP